MITLRAGDGVPSAYPPSGRDLGTRRGCALSSRHRFAPTPQMEAGIGLSPTRSVTGAMTALRAGGNDVPRPAAPCRAGHMGPALQGTAGMLTGRRTLQREALSLRTSDRVTGAAIRYPPPPSAREVSARSGDGGRDSAHPTAGHIGPALQSTAGMLTGRRPLQREALSLRTSDRVTGVAIRYPPPPSAREVSARSGDGGRDSAHPRAGHMGPALQSTAGMLTGRRLLQREAVTEGETAHIPRRDTWVPPYRARRVC